ncbi:hypothetical protein CA3LBN_000737 [Candidozyma haemuli]|uniref:Uncharacterized protein n=1 Tax=Candidozyma haemuli TaxID=45357 RepID=A0ABX8I0E5_9ASCO|nr:hypothetical protein CA3LBN_000737 [[Candida] haemuloni]
MSKNEAGGKKRILSKLFRKKSTSSPPSPQSTSTASTSFSTTSPTKEPPRPHKSSVSSNSGVYLDDDFTSIFNHADQSADDLNSHDSLDILSNYTLDDYHDDEFDRSGEQAFPVPEDSAAGNVPWAGLTGESMIFPKRIKINKRSNKSPRMLNNLFLAQELRCGEKRDVESVLSDVESSSIDLSENTSASSENESASMRSNEILVMEFSRDGKYLAAAGRDSKIYIWHVISSPLSRLQYKSREVSRKQSSKSKVFQYAPVFQQEPYLVFEGHTKSILTLDWSKNNFLISGSMDRTVKLWNVERSECLETFKHDDFVTTVKFHPNDDRFFLSGSLDNYVRLWSILDNSIAYSKNLGNDVLITALAFTPVGNNCIVGGFNGSLFGLETQGLHVLHRVELKERSLSSPFGPKHGNKITGIKVFENEAAPETSGTQFAKWNLLITTNDSKSRLIDMHRTRLLTRFKGATNTSSSIVSSLSDDNRFIISGSEDHWCYVWENNNSIINNKLKITLKELYNEGKQTVNHTHKKVNKLLHDNKIWRKLSLQRFLEDSSGQHYIPNENNSYACFHAHHTKVNCALFAPENTRRLLAFSDDIIYDLVRRAPQLDDYGILGSRKKEIGYAETVGLDAGHIIVTCDQTGLIKIFRQDSAYNIRRALVEFRKSNKFKCHPSQKPETTPNKDNLKLDLSGLNMRSVKTRSRSPAFEHTPSIKAKFHSQLRSRSGTSASPSRPPLGSNRTSARTIKGNPEVVTASSQISMKKLPKSGDLHSNYVTLPMNRNDHEDIQSLSDHSIFSGDDVLTPRSMSLTNGKSNDRGRGLSMSQEATNSTNHTELPRFVTSVPNDEGLRSQISKSDRERF